MSAIAIQERAQTAISLGESHFREFKSGLHGEAQKKVKRPSKDIAINISQTLVAFANADGGELLVGVEDNGEITGLDDFSEEELQLLENSPKTRVHQDTPLSSFRISRINVNNKTILYFSIPKSVKFVHLTSDGRCLQRRDLESVPIASEKIMFHRQEELSRHYDRDFVEGPQADSLDIKLINAVSDQILKGISPEKCLQYLELGEYSFSGLQLRRAALLLFAQEPSKWHPRLQVRIMKVDGTAMKTGNEYNITLDESVSGNILTLVEKSWESLRPHLVQTKFEKSAKFEQKSIYPELACREALLNAIAHRDYAQEGRGIEVYIYSDRLEIKNPGALLSTIKIADILSLTGAHQSRNTHIARVLRELGYMRELGEGMRRIHKLMKSNELAPPELHSSDDSFSIILKHKAIYSEKEQLWLEQFAQFNLDREKKAIILLGKNECIFSAQDIWDVVGIVDTEHYRQLVDSMMKFGILNTAVERNKAKALARKKRIPYREYPRYSINLPSSITPEETQSPCKIARNGEVRKEENKIWISNLSNQTTKEQLFELFSVYGEIEEIYMPLSAYEGKNKGYAFIEFSEKKIAQDLVNQESQVVLGNRTLTIRLAIRKN